MRWRLGIAALGIVVAAGAEAQLATERPPVGAPVRLETRTIAGRNVSGSLTVVNQGFVTLALDGSRPPVSHLSIPWSGISTISFGAGEDPRRGFATGALLGLSAAIIVYPALSHQDIGISPVGAALLSFGALPAAGAVVGAFHGPQRWRPVLWRPEQDTVLPEGEKTRLRLTPETWVLLRTPSRWVKARVLDTTDDSLVVNAASKRQAFAWEGVEQMKLRGRRSRIRGAALGVTLAAAATGIAIMSQRDVHPDPRIITRYLLAGAGLGAIIGSPEWTRIPVPQP